MNCAHAQELIQSKLDGDLSVEDAVRLGEHFAQCAECKNLSAEMEKLCRVVSTLPKHPAAGTLARLALADVPPHEIPLQRPVRSTHVFAVAAFAAAAMLVFALYPAQVVQHPDAIEANKTTAVTPPSTEIIKTNPSETPEQPAQPVAAAGRFDAFVVVQDLYEKPATPDPKGLEEQRARNELFAKLGNEKEAAAIAKQLAESLAPNDNELLWKLAAAVNHPRLGAEIFKGIAEVKPDLRLAPIYISALDSARTRARATELLRIVSGRKFGPQKETWVAWWIATRDRAQNSNSTERGG